MTPGGGWLVRRPRTVPARWRLLAIPHAGAGAGALSSWFRTAPLDCEVLLVRLPGREGRLREAPVTTVSAAVDGVRAALADARVRDLPLVVFGYSMGALIAYELTRALIADDAAPALLAVGGHEAAHLPRRESPIHALPDAEFVAALRALGGTPEEVLGNPELFALVAPTLRADLCLVETYQHGPGPLLNVAVTTYAGRADDTLQPGRVQAWSALTSACTRHRDFPGGHFFFTGPDVDLLAAVVEDSRDRLA